MYPLSGVVEPGKGIFCVDCYRMGVDKLLLNNEAFFIEVSQMLQSGNSVTLRAKGNSMLPFIMEERDTVVLQKAEAFAVGSVVLACLPSNRYDMFSLYSIHPMQHITIARQSLCSPFILYTRCNT